MNESGEPKSDKPDSCARSEASKCTPVDLKPAHKDRLIESSRVVGVSRSVSANDGSKQAKGERGLSESIKAMDGPQQVAEFLVQKNRDFLQGKSGDNSTFIFYTDGQREAAMAYAKSEGVNGVTLNMTPAGIELAKHAKEFEAKFGERALDNTWRSLSADFASKASGEVVWFGPRTNPPEMDRDKKIRDRDTNTTDGNKNASAADQGKQREMKVLFAEEWDTLRSNPKVTNIFIRSQNENGSAKVTGYVKGVLYEH